VNAPVLGYEKMSLNALVAAPAGQPACILSAGAHVVNSNHNQLLLLTRLPHITSQYTCMQSVIKQKKYRYRF
jgi:hypothetical protein